MSLNAMFTVAVWHFALIITSRLAGCWWSKTLQQTSEQMVCVKSTVETLVLIYPQSPVQLNG